jgi:hypothetical protein
MKTKLDYMKLCLHQWKWLEEHPMESKSDYLVNNSSVSRLNSGCAACHWTLKNHSTVSCSDCFLNHYAWKPEDYACERDEESPYRAWNDADEESDAAFYGIRREAAHRMVDAINLAIDDELIYLSLKDRT